jgi:hypothetical protein
MEEKAIEYPDELSSLLVSTGHAPLMLKVESEALERYFLRLVGMDGEKKR